MSFDGQSVELSEYWCGVYAGSCTDYKTSCMALGAFKFTDQGLRETGQETSTVYHVVSPEKYK